MKRIIYGLILLCSILSVVACSAEANGESDPAIDSTTLDGWYVETFNCCGKKLNYQLMKIDGEKEYYYWTTFEYSNSEINITYNDYDSDIEIENLTFDDDGGTWEMTTDENGTWLKCTTDPDFYGDFQKVYSPKKSGNGIGTIDFYTKDNIFFGIMCRNNKYYLLYLDSGNSETKNLNKNENTFTNNNISLTKTSDSEISITNKDLHAIPVPEGTYTRYVRNTPWPTVSAE